MIDRYTPGRKITPATERPSRLVSNGLDIRPLSRLSINLVSTRLIPQNGHLQNPSHIEDKRGRVNSVALTPVRVMPPLEAKRVPFGGERIIGGGTSREAIRTAQRKARRNGNRPR